MNKHELWSVIWNAKQAVDKAVKMVDELYEEELCQDTPKKSEEKSTRSEG